MSNNTVNTFGFQGHPYLLQHTSVDSLAQTLKSKPMAALDLVTIANNVVSNAVVSRGIMYEGKEWYAALIFPGGDNGIAVILPDKIDEQNNIRVYLKSEAAKDRAIRLLGNLSSNVERCYQLIPDLEELYQDR